jgi:hypothetical protein
VKLLPHTPHPLMSEFKAFLHAEGPGERALEGRSCAGSAAGRETSVYIL